MNFNHDTGLIDTIQTLDVTSLPPLGGIAQTLIINGTGSLVVPAGATIDRPSTPQAAMFRYNTDGNVLEYFNGVSWTTLSTGGGTVTSVAVQSNDTALTVTGSPITSSGTITLDLDNDLTAIAALTGVGFAARTGTETWALRTVTGTAGNIVVTNGDGVAGDPTLDLVSVGIPVSNQFVKITTDVKGRVTATTPVVTGDITSALGYTPVNKAGDTMTGTLTMSGGSTVTGLPAPTNASDAANKSYVDSVSAGLDPKESVRVATTVDLGGVYTNGTTNTTILNSAGNTPGYITIPNASLGVGLPLVVDGVQVQTGWRVLVKNQTTATQNGIYEVYQAGNGGTQDAILVRAADQDGTPSAEVSGGNFTFVEQGTVNADTGWVVIGNGLLTLETNNIDWTQFSGAGAVSLTFTADAGTVTLNSGDTLTVTGGAAISTSIAGTTLTVNANVDNSTLEIVGDQLRIKDQGVTDAKLRNSAALSVIGRSANSSGTPADISGIAGQVLRVDNTATSLGFGSIDLSNAATVGSSVLSIVNGGTGQTTALGAFNALSPLTTAGDILTHNGTNNIRFPVGTPNQVLTVATGGNALEYKTLTAGTGVTITPSAGTITIATSSTLDLYRENPSAPTTPSATGTNAVAIGNNSTASAVNSFGVGNGSNARTYGMFAYANGEFATAGDAQYGLYVLRTETTNNTVTEMFLDGITGTQRILLPTNSLFTFDILVAARRTDAVGGGAGYRVIGVIKKDATNASTTFVGTPSKTIIGETDGPWNVSVVADTTNGSLRVNVVGQTGKTIRWVATVRTTEVTN